MIILYDKIWKVVDFEHKYIHGQNRERQEASHPHSSIYLDDLKQNIKLLYLVIKKLKTSF